MDDYANRDKKRLSLLSLRAEIYGNEKVQGFTETLRFFAVSQTMDRLLFLF